ncbi:MAG: PqqD family peptide modification chaperone [Candidatus Microthrix subdominans]|uniref:PqqD family peptide modification chaperone n=1 Tax=Candidatus Neomicrothrix subdominans TaxID=2954438 RepID=A0A936NBF1_9ACTN|nr:PqqD family peptide modification chaperone [Candidatus Microthrix sp.]MBK9296574.1 PqqD family peptide modification chaperone [Candidatus Microthrix subdominans]MBK6310814.1 PqqD family peptide modification chaperone [Candidatus Microthrix sp.]MBK6440077.1 PqqD family peptide modification chaperone [Candidatus Microthrix sp.]MBK7166959.1 PqqD family peptide modification chaperone [Candidatus Microthrix sp.]MBK9558418.1 PqqD family peptide modification chaperone [Candidatus Microthrix sp.]
MPPFPERSPGVLLSPMGERAIAYDLITETAHQLNATAGTLLAACDGEGDVDAAVTAWAEDAGIDRANVAADVSAGLAMLTELGLIGRDEPFDAPKPPAGSTEEAADGAVTGGAVTGRVHPVIDHNIALRGPQTEVLEALDTFLGTGTDAEKPTMFFDVHETPEGELVLVTDYEWRFPSREACLRQLTSVVNEYAVWTHSCAAFHAGAVRSPDGQLVLLPAPSGNGKSTLTGAFVAAGWDYLGDEAIGVRPGSGMAVGYPKRLAIDASSRAVLNLPESDGGDLDPAEINADVVRLDGDVGPVNRVVLPTYEEGAEATLQRLEPHEAVVELLANTLNLARAGQAALDAVCDLAATVPVERLTHGNAHRAVALVSTPRP